MGDGSPRFWLPFQLLLMEEVKIGSHPLPVPPLRRQRPARLCLQTPTSYVFSFVRGTTQQDACSGVGVEEGRGRACPLHTFSRKENRETGLGPPGAARIPGWEAVVRCSITAVRHHRVRGRAIQKRPTVSGSRPPFTLTLPLVGSPPQFCFSDH